MLFVPFPSLFPVARTSWPRARHPIQCTYPPPPPVPVHSKLLWQHHLSHHIPASIPLPAHLHATFPDQFPTPTAAKRAVRRRQLLLYTPLVGWHLARTDHIATPGATIARLARIEMASVRRRPPHTLALPPPHLIRFRDSHIVVVAKPPAMRLYPDLREILFFAVGDTVPRHAEPAVLCRPTLVHRLDKVTGGLLLVALTPVALQRLSEQFRRRQVRKVYRARVEGRFDAQVSVLKTDVGGREAITEVEVVRYEAAWTELLLKPLTGRRHQLRVQLSRAGHPIVMDTTYGASYKEDLAQTVALAYGSGVICLWAEEISFQHPVLDALIKVKAQPPEDLFTPL